jgi:hypothetical protein
MWQLHAMLAHDLIDQRRREAASDRLVRRARQSRRDADQRTPRGTRDAMSPRVATGRAG